MQFKLAGQAAFRLALASPVWIRSDGPTLVSALALGGVRTKIRKPRLENARVEPGEKAVKCEGFTYFPRNPDHVDPPYEPSKLFAVRLVKSLYARPYWERRVLEGILGLIDSSKIAIVKNTPATNKVLYNVKHMIEITPITFPNGMPSDPKNGFLKANGEFVVYDKLGVMGAESIEQAQEDVAAVKKRDVDGETLKLRLTQQWLSRW